jgi:hypothetical protein
MRKQYLVCTLLSGAYVPMSLLLLGSPHASPRARSAPVVDAGARMCRAIVNALEARSVVWGNG